MSEKCDLNTALSGQASIVPLICVTDIVNAVSEGAYASEASMLGTRNSRSHVRSCGANEEQGAWVRITSIHEDEGLQKNKEKVTLYGKVDLAQEMTQRKELILQKERGNISRSMIKTNNINIGSTEGKEPQKEQEDDKRYFFDRNISSIKTHKSHSEAIKLKEQKVMERSFVKETISETDRDDAQKDQSSTKSQRNDFKKDVKEVSISAVGRVNAREKEFERTNGEGEHKEDERKNQKKSRTEISRAGLASSSPHTPMVLTENASSHHNGVRRERKMGVERDFHKEPNRQNGYSVEDAYDTLHDDVFENEAHDEEDVIQDSPIRRMGEGPVTSSGVSAFYK